MHHPLNALVVGAGLMGTWHAHAIRRIGGTVVGVVDPDGARADTLARRHPRARTFARLEDALTACSPDIVHVCTPLASHVSLVRAALEAGSHVLAEKPLASTAQETRALLELAASAQRLLVPVHQFAWQPGVLRLLERLPALGPIVHLEAATASAGAQQAPGAEADAVAADILPHFLALTRRVLGVTLAELPWRLERPRAGEWRALGRCGAITIGYLVSMATRPTFAELRLLGERGSARLDLFHGFGVFEGGTVSRVNKVIRPFAVAARLFTAASLNLVHRVVEREPAYPGLTELVRRVYLAVATGIGSPVPPAETLDIALTRDHLMTLATNV